MASSLKRKIQDREITQEHTLDSDSDANLSDEAGTAAREDCKKQKAQQWTGDTHTVASFCTYDIYLPGESSKTIVWCTVSVS
jgi:hypothetical protein